MSERQSRGRLAVGPLALQVPSTMNHFPDFAKFSALCATHDLIPVYRRLYSDTLTPVTAFHRLDEGGSACLFESVIGGEKVGRYSFLAAGPYLEMLASGSRVTEIRGGVSRTSDTEDPLELLRSRLGAVRAAHLPELPPFAGGAVGYAGYDVVRYVEHLPHAPQDDRGLPDMAFGFYDRMVVFDHVTKTMFVIATAHVNRHAGDAAAAYDEARHHVDAMVDRLITSDTDLYCRDINVPTSGMPDVAYRADFRAARI